MVTHERGLIYRGSDDTQVDLGLVARLAREALHAIRLGRTHVRIDRHLAAVVIGRDDTYPSGVVGIGVCGFGEDGTILAHAILVNKEAFPEAGRYSRPWGTDASGRESPFVSVDDETDRPREAVRMALERLVEWRLERWVSSSGA